MLNIIKFKGSLHSYVTILCQSYNDYIVVKISQNKYN